MTASPGRASALPNEEKLSVFISKFPGRTPKKAAAARGLLMKADRSAFD